MDYNRLKGLIFMGGVVGSGGAGFPTHMKLSPSIDTIIINGAECEPLLGGDKLIINNDFEALEQTLSEMLKVLGAQKAFFAVKEKNAPKKMPTRDNILIKIIPDIYPVGDEVILTYEVTGRIIKEGALPLEQGVVVLNVETLLNIHNAINSKPVTHKYVSVAGHVENPHIVYAPIGTYIHELMPSDLEGFSVIEGGPLMGTLTDPYNKVVTKTTNGLIVLPSEHYLVRKKSRSLGVSLNRGAGNCCQCGVCTELCPRYLLGYDLRPHKAVVAASSMLLADYYTQCQLCCSCGVCSYVACLQEVCPGDAVAAIKNKLAAAGFKLEGNSPKEVRPERSFRQIPAMRIIERTGLFKYYKKTLPNIKMLPAQRVRIPLKQHIGKPATCCVATGDFVEKGQLIAASKPNEISACIHASISGTARVFPDCIEIEAVLPKTDGKFMNSDFS